MDTRRNQKEIPAEIEYPVAERFTAIELRGQIKEQRAALIAELDELIAADLDAAESDRAIYPCLSQTIAQLHAEIRLSIDTGDYFRCDCCGDIKHRQEMIQDDYAEVCEHCAQAYLESREIEDEQDAEEAACARWS